MNSHPPEPPESAAASPSQITRLLETVRAGRASAAEQLLPLVYDELRALAASYFRDQRADHTLQPTALVHEAYAKMVKADGAADSRDQWTSRAHFFAVAAKAMRQVLSNHARDRNAAKRGGDRRRITLSEHVAVSNERDIDLLTLDEALAALAELDERQARIVELRFFGEVTAEEIGHVLGLSVSTVEREWRMARAWLSGRLREGAGES